MVKDMIFQGDRMSYNIVQAQMKAEYTGAR